MSLKCTQSRLPASVHIIGIAQHDIVGDEFGRKCRSAVFLEPQTSWPFDRATSVLKPLRQGCLHDGDDDEEEVTFKGVAQDCPSAPLLQRCSDHSAVQVTRASSVVAGKVGHTNV